MDRTTIVLPPDLKFQVQNLARENHISFAEFIRDALKAQIEKLSKNKKSDLFFEDRDFFNGEAPKDLSENHDDYLY